MSFENHKIFVIDDMLAGQRDRRSKIDDATNIGRAADMKAMTQWRLMLLDGIDSYRASEVRRPCGMQMRTITGRMLFVLELAANHSKRAEVWVRSIHSLCVAVRLCVVRTSLFHGCQPEYENPIPFAIQSHFQKKTSRGGVRYEKSAVHPAWTTRRQRGCNAPTYGL